MRKWVFLPPTISLSERSPSAQSNSFSRGPRILQTPHRARFERRGDGNKMGTGEKRRSRRYRERVWERAREREREREKKEKRANEWNFTVNRNPVKKRMHRRTGAPETRTHKGVHEPPTYKPYLAFLKQSVLEAHTHTHAPPERPVFTNHDRASNCDPNSYEVNPFCFWKGTSEPLGQTIIYTVRF